MLRLVVLLVMFVAASVELAVAQTGVFFRVDGNDVSVPPQFESDWERARAMESWETVSKTTIHGQLQRLVVRQFDVFTTDDGKQCLKVTWLVGEKCRTKVMPVSELDKDEVGLLSAIYRQSIESIIGRKTADVVFCEFSGAITAKAADSGAERPTTPEPGASETAKPADGTKAAATGSTKPQADSASAGAAQTIPYRFLAGEGRALLLPFSNAARVSFQRRLAAADCNKLEEAKADAALDKPQPQSDENAKPNEGDNDGERLPKFGFKVMTFKSEAGSLIFKLEREFDVCISARDLATAYRKLRDRFPQVISQAGQPRTSYRFRPSDKACAEVKPPVDDAGNSAGSVELVPTADPVSTRTGTLDEIAIPK